MLTIVMGVATWMFPRPARDETRYRPELVEAVYWLMTLSTALRAVAEILLGVTGTPARLAHRRGRAGSLAEAILFVLNMWWRAHPRRRGAGRRAEGCAPTGLPRSAEHRTPTTTDTRRSAERAARLARGPQPAGLGQDPADPRTRRARARPHRLAAAAPRCRLRGAALAGRPRGAGRDRDGAGHLLRGAGAGPGPPSSPRCHRPRHGGSRHHGARHRGATAPTPAAHPRRSMCSARASPSPMPAATWPLSRHGPSAVGTPTSSRAARCGHTPSRTSRTGARSWPVPIRRPESTGLTYYLVDVRVSRASRCVRCADQR